MASKRGLRRKACTGKVRHESSAGAESASRKLRKKYGILDALATYRCPFCNGFHVGHPPASVRRAMKGN